jgi:alpha-L-fucosidase
VEEIGAWTAVNGEGIYGSRPWKIYGEQPAGLPSVKSGNFNENKVKYSDQDIRFTTQGDKLYVFCLDRPAKDISIRSLGHHSKTADKAIASVSMLGSEAPLHWKQKGDALIINRPTKLPVEQVPVPGFRIDFRK